MCWFNRGYSKFGGYKGNANDEFCPLDLDPQVIDLLKNGDNGKDDWGLSQGDIRTNTNPDGNKLLEIRKY